MSEIRNLISNLWKRHNRGDVTPGGPAPGSGYGLGAYGQTPYGS